MYHRTQTDKKGEPVPETGKEERLMSDGVWRDDWETEEEDGTEFGGSPGEGAYALGEGVMQTGHQHDPDVVRLQLQCPEFSWVRDALQPGRGAEGPPPGPTARWMDRKGKQGKLTLKFTKEGDPVIQEIDSQGRFRTIVPEQARRELFLKLHRHHRGTQTTTEQLSRGFNWPGMTTDIKRWIERCPTCTERKVRDQKEGAPDDRSADNVNERWYLDLMGPFNPAGESRYIMTVMDAFSRYLWVHPLRDKGAATIAEKFTYD